jgi:hypothetical protein
MIRDLKLIVITHVMRQIGFGLDVDNQYITISALWALRNYTNMFDDCYDSRRVSDDDYFPSFQIQLKPRLP